MKLGFEALSSLLKIPCSVATAYFIKRREEEGENEGKKEEETRCRGEEEE